MKNLMLNEDACIGCGCCIAVDPEHFDFNDDGLAKIIKNDNLETNSLNNALGSCPTNAITVDNDDKSNEHSSCNCTDCTCGPECSC